jgi:uncharacterized protein (TIGR02757 family)
MGREDRRAQSREFLRCRLESLYAHYNRRDFIHPDPLEFLYDYDQVAEREIVGVIASSLAFGRVAQIQESISFVLKRMQPGPVEFLKSATRTSLEKTFAGFRHRWVDGRTLSAMLIGIKGAVERYGSLESAFLACTSETDETTVPAAFRFIAELSADTDDACNRLLPLPTGRSACKRIHLFLRWMVRCDGVDPGGWNAVNRGKLVVPLDVHMHKVGLALGFTRRKVADLRAATEITSGFKAIVPEDPVKFDFALTRLGIRQDADLPAFLKNISDCNATKCGPEAKIED